MGTRLKNYPSPHCVSMFLVAQMSQCYFQDPVLNVRLKFCNVPPRLKSLLKLPTDRHLLQQLEQCVRKLHSSEKEPDVCAAVREVSKPRDYSIFCILFSQKISPLTLREMPLMLSLTRWDCSSFVGFHEVRQDEIRGR